MGVFQWGVYHATNSVKGMAGFSTLEAANQQLKEGWNVKVTQSERLYYIR